MFICREQDEFCGLMFGICCHLFIVLQLQVTKSGQAVEDIYSYASILIALKPYPALSSILL